MTASSAGTNRQAVVLYGAGDLRVEQRATAPLADGAVRVRFRAGGICGSDLHYFRHGRTGNFILAEPLILGHEIAGEIADVTGSAADEGLAVGARVAVNPARFCGVCGPCRDGRQNLCEAIFFMGSASRTPHMQGGFVETLDVHRSQCFPVPAHVPLSHAALAEPLAVCLHAAERAGPLAGRSVTIMGAGPIGLILLLVCRHKGASRIGVADVAVAPLRHAERLGADSAVDVAAVADPGELRARLAGGAGPDVVFEASGSPAALASAIEIVRRGGTIVQVGNLPGAPLPIPASAVMAKELDLKGSFRFANEFDRAVGLIADGTIDVSALITAELPFDKAPEAFALAGDRDRSIKVMLRH